VLAGTLLTLVCVAVFTLAPPWLCCRGFNQFISRNDLLSGTFLGDTDTLTVQVDVHLWRYTSPYSLLAGCAAQQALVVWCSFILLFL
jgi:hypothetical protein